jgi:hypothetical protein
MLSSLSAKKFAGQELSTGAKPESLQAPGLLYVSKEVICLKEAYSSFFVLSINSGIKMIGWQLNIHFEL